MNHENRVNTIRTLCATIVSKVGGEAQPKEELEVLVRDLLRITEGRPSLDWLHEEQRNHPAIDLGDKEGRWAVQVTKHVTPEKVKATLRVAEESGLEKVYSRITFFDLSQTERAKPGRKSQATSPNGKIQMDWRKDVWTWERVVTWSQGNIGGAERILHLLEGYKGPVQRRTFGVTTTVPTKAAPGEIQREIYGKLKEAIQRHPTVWVEGEAGIGKSVGVEAALRNVGVHEVKTFWVEREDDNEILGLLNELGTETAPFVVVENIQWAVRGRFAAALEGAVAQRERAGLRTVITTEDISGNPPGRRKETQETVRIPGLTVEEVKDLLAEAGGPEADASVIHVAAGYGHTQLCAAAVEAYRLGGWEKASLFEVVMGDSTEQTRNRRDVAKRLLHESKVWDVNLLARLGMRTVPYSEGFAEAATGCTREQLEAVKGYWIRQEKPGEWRSSPLLAGFRGRLTEEEYRAAHSQWAQKAVERRREEPIDIDATLIHAITGGNDGIILHVCLALIAADDDGSLARRSSAIVGHKLKVHDLTGIRPVSKAALCILQIHGAEDGSAGINETVAHARAAIQEVEESKLRDTLNGIWAWKSALKMGQELDPAKAWGLGKIVAEQTGNHEAGIMLFCQAFSQVRSTEALIAGIQALGKMPLATREAVLGFEEGGVVKGEWLELGVDKPWVEQHRAGTVSSETVEQYNRVLQEARETGIEILEAKARTSLAVIWSEYLEANRQATDVLRMEVEGRDARRLLQYGRGKILAQQHDYAKAELVFRDAENHRGNEGDCNAMLRRRTAGVSAHNGKLHEAGAEWFLKAAEAARAHGGKEAPGRVLGLQSDAAVQLTLAGKQAQGEELLLNAVERASRETIVLEDMGLQARGLVPHVALWMHRRTEWKGKEGQDEGFGIYGGICSNPEPHASLRQSPGFAEPESQIWLGVKYELALAEIDDRQTSGRDAAQRAIEDDIGCLRGCELMLACQRYAKAIIEQDWEAAIRRHAEIIAWGSSLREASAVARKGLFGGYADRAVATWECEKTRIPDTVREETFMACTVAAITDKSRNGKDHAQTLAEIHEAVGLGTPANAAELPVLKRREAEERWRMLTKTLRAMERDRRGQHELNYFERTQHKMKIWASFANTVSRPAIEETLGRRESPTARKIGTTGCLTERLGFLEGLVKAVEKTAPREHTILNAAREHCNKLREPPKLGETAEEKKERLQIQAAKAAGEEKRPPPTMGL